MTEAADVLEPVVDDVVVFGAVAVEVALSETAVTITPTRDVDLLVANESVEAVVAHLETAQLRPSELAHERSFTWVRGDLKVQLVRPYHPQPPPALRGLPEQTGATMGQRAEHQTTVAFVEQPARRRLVVASSATVAALKQKAFGRTRFGDDRIVQRDFHDVHLLVREVPDLLLEDYARARYDVRVGLELAVDALADDPRAADHAGREAASLVGGSVASARADVRRTATRFRRRLHEAYPQAAQRLARRQEPLR